jgi:hypothetical protein
VKRRNKHSTWDACVFEVVPLRVVWSRLDLRRKTLEQQRVVWVGAEMPPRQSYQIVQLLLLRQDFVLGLELDTGEKTMISYVRTT